MVRFHDSTPIRGAGEQGIHKRFDQTYKRMLVQNRWLVGSIALFGTVISILLGIGQVVK
jgi:hypothetical protein